MKTTDEDDDEEDGEEERKKEDFKGLKMKCQRSHHFKSKTPTWNSNVVDGVEFANHEPYKVPTQTPLTSTFTTPRPPLASRANQYYVPINRTEETELARASLPILREEQQIMESILGNTTTILCGETGSGKTTQLPQFLYEHGFGNPAHPLYSGQIAITQPRRVAAVSMAKRVAEEMNVDLKTGPVGHHGTRIKFMTEGILLRELSAGAESGDSLISASKGGDLLLTKYSVIIIDEAHERTVGTDVLIGWLTRIAALRNGGKVAGVKPLKLGIPPVVKVDGRQFKVTIHYNKVTPETDYVSEAYKKVAKIHTKLPHGAILVFLTGQSEITALVKKLRKAYPPKTGAIEEKKNQLEKPSTADADGETSMFGETEDGATFDEEIPNGREDGVDDFDDGEFLDEDDEEEDVEVLAGADGEDGPELSQEDRESMPLHVLPLNPTLCRATNVAETSLTIPGIKYVIDCGKVKERRYDTHSGVQTFQIGWTSRASADQRAGRAGRVGPGHCYRLFSSAVFANHFEQFSRPEMLRVPIEGVVLQMKSMGISNVLNFPFPTPPGRDNLPVERGASVDATEGGGKITELVKCWLSSLLIIAADQAGYTLPYTIALVSGLSVGDPFIRDDNVTGRKNDDDDDGDDDKEEKSKKVGEWHRVMQMFAGEQVNSDALKILRAVGAYSAAAAKSSDGGAQFMESHFLRPKAIEEINRLRVQLSTLVKATLTKDTVGLQHLPTNSNGPIVIPPPTLKDTAVLRQILLAGFPDHIARYDVVATKTALGTGAKNIKPIYSTMWGGKTDVFTIHASSALASVRPAPQWIIYEEVVGVEERLTADNSGIMFLRSDSTVVAATSGQGKRLMLKNVTVITEDWIAKVGPKSLLKPGKLMEQPSPRYDAYKDKVVGFSAPNYGPKMWELPTMEVDVDLKNGAQWFAMALLEGHVRPGQVVRKQKAKSKVVAAPDMFGILLVSIFNREANYHYKVLVQNAKSCEWIPFSLINKNIASRSALEKIWYEQPGFLLPEYLSWLPNEVHMAVQLIWPPIEFVQEYEVIPSAPSARQKAPPATEKPGIAKKLQPFLANLPKGDDLRRREVSAAAAQDSGEDSD
ncbi:P-loop containing nucleoside triphosphate hydrolase protein [Rhizoclosmatium globosum]|uniref:p-loop containing nucleoside triphosphate hydrolase protein n=1 Tax=Rhizoclosmatium globosum TaxID=329046 RepID=A0A1Y2BPP6_9FUNG|nr:P-loop containing nucleoside triphosphate hydrolase protein [Rhizoclosmatium globosum]|eukprot:ORY36721.1 P-loop containing nucleoside triphosphate hydrolase protein [Rhizoclosmatium globosum]